MAALLAGCETNPRDSGVAALSDRLLAPWQGPYGGVPDFSVMTQAGYFPALRAALREGMADSRAGIARIAANPESPTFANTIEALERNGAALQRAQTYWRVSAGNLASPEFRALQVEMAPELAAFNAEVLQNARLFARVEAVRDGADAAGLSDAQRRLVDGYFDRFARNGATLSGEPARRFADIQQVLARLHAQFANNVLADEEGYVTLLSAAQLGGLPDSVIASARKAAADRGVEGYAITNTRSSMDPFLTYSTERKLRERVWRSFYNRGSNAGDHDNRPLIEQILRLREERVALLGYDSYAAWRLENRMAGTPERAMALLERLWPAARAKVLEEVADMQRLADSAGDAVRIAPWDYRYYAEKVRQQRYDLDSNEVMQYLQLDQLREAMFFVAGELFDLRFTPVAPGSVPVFHPDVRVWEVNRAGSDALVGLWYLDPYARTGKGSGAWATTYRVHSTFDGPKNVLSSNNSNFIKAAPGEPLLLSWDDAETLFHEFGHSLHALVSNVDYPTLNWGVRDYTEFHSQLFERWLLTEPVVSRYLRHHATGEPMPADLVSRLRASKTFNQGFATAEYLVSALLDMRFHTTDSADIDAAEFERATLVELEMPEQIVARHRPAHFGHVFESEGYAAGYYGYIWSDILAADAAEVFEAAPGGYYDPAVAEKMVTELFAPRNAVEPLAAYKRFRGAEPGVEPLLRSRGLLAD